MDEFSQMAREYFALCSCSGMTKARILSSDEKGVVIEKDCD